MIKRRRSLFGKAKTPAPAAPPVDAAPDPAAPTQPDAKADPAPPKPVAAAPETQPAPAPVVAAPEPVAAAPEPVEAAAEPVVAAPEPVVAAPEPPPAAEPSAPRANTSTQKRPAGVLKRTAASNRLQDNFESDLDAFLFGDESEATVGRQRAKPTTPMPNLNTTGEIPVAKPKTHTADASEFVKTEPTPAVVTKAEPTKQPAPPPQETKAPRPAASLRSNHDAPAEDDILDSSSGLSSMFPGIANLDSRSLVAAAVAFLAVGGTSFAAGLVSGSLIASPSAPQAPAEAVVAAPVEQAPSDVIPAAIEAEPAPPTEPELPTEGEADPDLTDVVPEPETVAPPVTTTPTKTVKKPAATPEPKTETKTVATPVAPPPPPPPPRQDDKGRKKKKRR